MKPIQKLCIELAANAWKDQPSLGMLETINEVRVELRAYREFAGKSLPGSAVMEQWFTEAIEAGELSGPGNSPRGGRGKKAKSSRV